MFPLPPTSRGSVSIDGSQGEMTCANTLVWMVSIGSHVDGDGDGDLFHQMTKSVGRACWWRCWRTLRAALVLHRGLCSICCWAGNQKLLQRDRAMTWIAHFIWSWLRIFNAYKHLRRYHGGSLCIACKQTWSPRCWHILVSSLHAFRLYTLRNHFWCWEISTAKKYALFYGSEGCDVTSGKCLQ
jgi:hypothetical protein